MFFELHDEKKIGYKKLSDADLGISTTSHQTHIGLSEHALGFLEDKDVISEDSIFIFEDKFEYIDAYFDRIQNPDGSFRSPKIRIGEKNGISIVSTIRGIVGENKQKLSWYLVWFGLKNEKLVFYLFNEHSLFYKKLVSLKVDMDKKGARCLDVSDTQYNSLVSHIEELINSNAQDILKDLEVKVQTKDIAPNRKYKAYDIAKINRLNMKLGREGEERVAHYLEKLVQQKLLKHYEWVNEHSESGLPYDFHIQDNYDNVTFLDVKTTGYDFSQDMVFSNQELCFITKEALYSIYRVYKNERNEYLLRICENCQDLARDIHEKTQEYANSLKEIPVTLQSSKITISPNLSRLTFGREEHL